MRFMQIRHFVLVLLAIMVTACGEQTSLAATSPSSADKLETEDYLISIQATESEKSKVTLSVTTNIPGTIELMASVNLANQAPDDTYIGKSERIKVTNGSAKTVIDVGSLPSGQYEAEAAFYPRWGFKDQESESTGINRNISATQPIVITGSGESKQSVATRNKNQKWVIENVIVGTPWKPDEWESRFGKREEIPVKSRNPEIIKNYYFPTLDMTIIVNTLKEEVVTWRMSKDGL